MPTISKVVRVGDPDANGNANFVLTIDPDLLQPGHGDVSDKTGHSSQWDSATGDPATTLVFGKPPFSARQFQMTVSASVSTVHEVLAASAPPEQTARAGKPGRSR